MAKVKEVTSEEVDVPVEAVDVPVETVEIPTPEEIIKPLTLEEFIAENKPNIGLVASFKVENADKLDPRSPVAWSEDFEAQSKKEYK